jgi:toxin YoeB
MVKRRLIWSKNSIKERNEIFDYWNNRNKSKKFSQKLYHLFLNAIEPLKENPEIGILNNKNHFRYILVKEYLIFYDYNDAEIIIHKIWDGRRNPENLEI